MQRKSESWDKQKQDSKIQMKLITHPSQVSSYTIYRIKSDKSVGERTNVGDNTWANSQTQISTSVFGAGHRLWQPDAIGDKGQKEESNSYFTNTGSGSSSLQEGGTREDTGEESQKDIPEKDLHVKNNGNDLGLELVATKLSHHLVPPIILKTESDSDLPFTGKQSLSKHALPSSSSSSSLKHALPSHMQ
ncbi:hypothetical protein HOY80DRAFT_1090508 [Tuber brumale]|nr:hypothetical protein HOY80DRAFT_1090508 [Tuber brumale]